MWQVIPAGQQLARCQLWVGLREAALRASDLGRTRRPPLPTKREARGLEIVCAISTWLSSILGRSPLAGIPRFPDWQDTSNEKQAQRISWRGIFSRLQADRNRLCLL